MLATDNRTRIHSNLPHIDIELRMSNKTKNAFFRLLSKYLCCFLCQTIFRFYVTVIVLWVQWISSSAPLAEVYRSILISCFFLIRTLIGKKPPIEGFQFMLLKLSKNRCAIFCGEEKKVMKKCEWTKPRALRRMFNSLVEVRYSLESPRFRRPHKTQTKRISYENNQISSNYSIYALPSLIRLTQKEMKEKKYENINHTFNGVSWRESNANSTPTAE